MNRTKKILEEYMEMVDPKDPKEVETKSSERIINLLLTYYMTDKDD